MAVRHLPIVSPGAPGGKAPGLEKVPGPASVPNGKKVYVETYGCQMNVADSDMVTSILTTDGYEVVSAAEAADVVLLNTCAIRDRAEERIYKRLLQLKPLKKDGDVVLGVLGCMAEHVRDAMLDRAPYVDVIVGPDAYRGLPNLLFNVQADDSARMEACVDVGADLGLHREQIEGSEVSLEVGAPKTGPQIDVRLNKEETYVGIDAALGGDGVSGYVSIQRGCDKFCTFCVVPFTRGRERALPPREVLRQVRRYVDCGYREVVLLGQTVNSYRYEDVSFAELLRVVAEVPGVRRVRCTSPYPIDFSDDVIAVIAEEPSVCASVHLPLQSGSDDVLAIMKRGYTISEYLDIVHRLRKSIPGIAITTDVMTGFCGESEQDHQKTLEIMEQVRFDSAFMFMYSERSVTYAAKKLQDDIPEAVKKRRLAEIIQLQERISREVYAEQVGKVEEVLIHGPSKRSDKDWIGRTQGFKSVIVPVTEDTKPGDFVKVKIEKSTMATLFGCRIP